MTSPHSSRMDAYRPQPHYHTYAEESTVASASSPSAFGSGPFPPPRLPSPSPSAPRSYNPRERFFHPPQPPTPSGSSSGAQAPLHPGYTYLPPPSPTAPFPSHGPLSSSAPQSRRLVPPSGLIPPFGPRLPSLFSGPQYDSSGVRRSEPSYSPSQAAMRPGISYSSRDSRGPDASGTRGSEPRAYNIKDEDSATDGGSPPKRKRAKTGNKITRNRKITSCLPCRDRKQKCDRTHPICQKCIDDGRDCVYATNEDQDGPVSASPLDTKKKLKTSSAGASDNEQKDPLSGASSSGGASAGPHQNPGFLAQRRENLAILFTAARDRTLDFEKRVEAARAAAVAEVLFAENEVQDLRKDHLILPTREQVQPLLDIYKQDVELFNFIVLIDLNRSRIGGFLDWWHSNPVTLPVDSDAPLAPLVLAILALASQAKRTRDSANAMEGSDPQIGPAPTSNDKYLPYLSSERVLLETAGKCIASLTIVCPSSWNSTYSSPLDVVRAEVLRTLWHIGECHLQYAANCIASALRLAYAAGLHRDPLHWKNVGMGPYEVQVRRSTWWNVAFLETFHSHRIGQPSLIIPGTVDTELPTNYDIVAEQHARASITPMTRKRFYSLVTQLHVAQLFLQHSGKVFLLNLQPNDIVRGLSEIYKLWVAGMPKELQKLSRETNSSESGYRPGLQVERRGGAGSDYSEESEEEAQAFRWSIFLIRIQKLQGLLNVHRPACEVGSGCIENDAQAVSGLRICLEASARLVYLCHEAIMSKPGPPHLLLGIISYYSFNAGAVLASQFSSQTAYSSICRPAFQKALSVLDHLAKNQALGNVSEQAERYCAAVREIAAIPEMFQKKLTPSNSQMSSAQSERSEAEMSLEQSGKPTEDQAAPRLASPMPSPLGESSASYARNAPPQLNYAHGTFASPSQSQTRYNPEQQQGQGHAVGAANGLVYDHQGQHQNVSFAGLPGPPDQFLSAGRAKASSNITDRPLPGRNPLGYSHFALPVKGDPNDQTGVASEPYYEAVMAAVPMPSDLPRSDENAWLDTADNAVFAGGAPLSASTASPLSAGGAAPQGVLSGSHHQQQQQQQQQQPRPQQQQYDTFPQYPHNVDEGAGLHSVDLLNGPPVGVDWPLLGDFVQRILQGENVSDMPAERRGGQGRNQYKLGGGPGTAAG